MNNDMSNEMGNDMGNDTGGPPIEALSTSTCWSLVRGVVVGRIAFTGLDGDVEIFPVNVVVDRGSIVFRTAAGAKLAFAETGGRSTFEADDVDQAHDSVWSVVMKGPTSVIRGHQAVIDTFEVDVHAWHAGRKPTYVRLTPDVVTGRRFVSSRATRPTD